MRVHHHRGTSGAEGHRYFPVGGSRGAAQSCNLEAAMGIRLVMEASAWGRGGGGAMTGNLGIILPTSAEQSLSVRVGV
jgi:hypothetical protein